MTNTFDGHELHARLRALTDARDWPAATAVVRALPHVSAEELNGYPNGDLWWHFAEPLADQLAASEPDLARRVFELVEMSLVKEASMASGPGEAAAVQPNLRRVRAKLER